MPEVHPKETTMSSSSPVTCGNCGQAPMGEACYHLCFNSVHYYSREQERYDDAMDDGSDDHRERYASELRDIDMWVRGEEEGEAVDRLADLIARGEVSDASSLLDLSPDDLVDHFAAVDAAARPVVVAVDTSDDLPF